MTFTALPNIVPIYPYTGERESEIFIFCTCFARLWEKMVGG